MIQPITVTSQEPDGRIIQQTQYQLISQTLDDLPDSLLVSNYTIIKWFLVDTRK